MTKLIVRMVIVLILSLICGCASFCRIDGPYKGKVVDAETQQPLPGVVVLGVWNKVQLTVGGPTGGYYDSREVVTDRNGEFEIPGKGLLLFSNIDEMNLFIFKAGYQNLGYGSWSDFKTVTGGRGVRFKDDMALISLKRLAYDERRKQRVSRPNIDRERMPLFTDEINKERIEFGLDRL